jgi:hypothetical protein
VLNISLAGSDVLNISLSGALLQAVQDALPCAEAGVLVKKLSQLTPLSSAKRAKPKYFIMLCGISCELVSCVHRPIVDSVSTIASLGQTKP